MWSNFHTHSEFCDGKGTVAEIAATAGSLDSLGFSSHAPLPFECSWCMRAESLPSYLASIERLQASQSVKFYKGLEVDFIPHVVSPAQFAPQLDYTIGSIHFVEQWKDGRHWEIDGAHALFLQGLQEIFNNDIRAAITQYYKLTGEMLITGTPTILGHMDKIKIQNPGDKFFKESEAWYQEEIRNTLAIVKDLGTVVEVNTRGIYQKKSTTPYPSPWILEFLFQYEIPVVLSSDAHQSSDLTRYFPEMANLLGKIGFKKLTTLIDGKWQQVPFNENGFILEPH